MMPDNNYSDPISGTTVIKEPIGTLGIAGDYILYMASVADNVPIWGTAPATRDQMLRAFWPTEPILASALFSTISRYAAFGWTLQGPPKTVSAVQGVLHGVELGDGWISLITKTLIDLFTQDNGAFIEIVRTADTPTAPVISLNHLDANRCVRTGLRQEPVIYYDVGGQGHSLKWFQVIKLTEFPSPIERARGMQYCVITRLLRAAQVMKDIGVYEREKISGRFNRAIHLIGGVQSATILKALESQRQRADEENLRLYLQPLIIAALDPTSTVTKQTIELASMPDGFNRESAFKWYVNQLALAFGSDYQDYAPMPQGNLGSSQQSQILHMKSRGRGPKLFMSMIEHMFNFHGIMPATVKFIFGDQDIAEDMDHARLRQMRAQERQIRIASNEITPQIARQIAVDVGDLDPKYLDALNESDLTTATALQSTGPLDVGKSEGGAPLGNQYASSAGTVDTNNVSPGQVK
jgi:hypothetical protein